MYTYNKAHARKGKSLSTFSAKKFFQIFLKIQNLLSNVESNFHIDNYTFPPQL